MNLELAFAGMYLCAAANAVIHGGRMKRFLAETPVISDSLALERFKAVARQNMVLALIQAVLLVSGILVGILLIARHGLPGLAGTLAANGVIFALGKHYGTMEKRIRELPAASEELAGEHRRVSESWVKKALPDF